MKKILIKKAYLVAGCVALLSISFDGCKRYLDVNPQGQITQAQIATDPAAAQNLVTGIYNVFYIGGFDPDIDSFQFVIMTDIASDDSDKGSSPNDYGDALQIDNLQTPATNGVVNNVWNGHYQGIARTNQALGQLQTATFDATTKNKLLAETRFLRAYFYFNLVRLFGGVPKLDHVPSVGEANSAALQTRASAADIYAFIVSDLDFAVANLPDKGATDVGRATKSAAQGLEAKVYLYMKNYQKAYDLSQAVITGGKYSLVKDYSLIWRQNAVNGDGGNNNSESLFEIQAGINKDCSAGINLYSVSQGPRAGGKYGWSDLGFGFNNPTSSLVNEYETGDVRKNGTIIFINPTTGITPPSTAPGTPSPGTPSPGTPSPGTTSSGTVLFDGFRIPSQDSVQNSRYSYKAYHSRTAEANCGGNTDRLPKQVRILRYADVLLINAEAALQLGNTGAATTNLNQVRTRAGLTSVTATLLAIWHERRVELAMEHDRFFDLVRQDAVQPGRAAAAFTADGGKTWSATRALFPIPQAQIDLSGGNLKQNPGY